MFMNGKRMGTYGQTSGTYHPAWYIGSTRNLTR